MLLILIGFSRCCFLFVFVVGDDVGVVPDVWLLWVVGCRSVSLPACSSLDHQPVTINGTAPQWQRPTSTTTPRSIPTRNWWAPSGGFSRRQRTRYERAPCSRLSALAIIPKPTRPKSDTGVLLPVPAAASGVAPVAGQRLRRGVGAVPQMAGARHHHDRHSGLL